MLTGPITAQPAAVLHQATSMPMVPRMGTPVVQMGYHQQSPFMGGRTSVHSYPPATASTVIHRRGPVRRKLWVTETETEDDDMYEDLLTRRLHNRRVKRALESLGIKPKRQRLRRDDDY